MKEEGRAPEARGKGATGAIPRSLDSRGETHCPQSGNVTSRIVSHMPGVILGAGGRKVMGFTS